MHNFSTSEKTIGQKLNRKTPNQKSYINLYRNCLFCHTRTIGLRGVKRELLLALTKCQRVKACQDVLEEYEIGKLDVNGIDYDQVTFKFFSTEYSLTAINLFSSV